MNRTLKVSPIHKSQSFTFNRLFSLMFGCHSTVQNAWATLHLFVFWFQAARLCCNLKWCLPIVLQAFVFFFSCFFTHFQSSLVFSHRQRDTQRVISWKPGISCHVVECVHKKFKETGQAKTNNEVSDLKIYHQKWSQVEGWLSRSHLQGWEAGRESWGVWNYTKIRLKISGNFWFCSK